MAHLYLGKSSLVTSVERDALATLRSRYMKEGLRHRARFLEAFSAIKSADELFQDELPTAISRAVGETVTMAAADIAEQRVYDVDLAAIRLELGNRVATVRDSFDRVQDRYYEIIGKAAELDAQRTEDRENRGRIVGGGFGVEGAVQGMAIGAAANAAIGLAYGLVNLTGKAASMLGDAKKKRALMADPATKRDLADFLCRVVLQGYKLVGDTVNERTGDLVLEVVSDDDQRRSAALVENVNAGRVPKVDIAETLIRALEADPFADKTWTAWIDEFGDADGSVEKSAQMLGVTIVAGHKQKLFSREGACLDWSTPEACEKHSPTLEAHANRLGLSFDEERKRIRLLAENLDRQRRTYNGVVYQTMADMHKAREAQAKEVERKKAEQEETKRAQAEIARRTFKGVTYDTIDDARQAYRTYNRRQNQIIAACFLTPIALAILFGVWKMTTDPLSLIADKVPSAAQLPRSKPIASEIRHAGLEKCFASDGQIPSLSLEIKRRLSNSNTFHHEKTTALPFSQTEMNADVSFHTTLDNGKYASRSITAQIDPTTCAVIDLSPLHLD